MLSIIITNYNYNDYLQEAIDSCGDNDVIVVDDCSEETPKVDCKLIVNKENKGLAESRNIGILASNGDRIICLDADDKLDEEFINYCKEYEGKDFVIYGDYKYFGIRTGNERTQEFTHGIIEQNFIPCCACFSKTLWEKYPYNPVMKYGYEDWDFWVGCYLNKANFVKTNLNMFYYRKHSSSMIDKTVSKHDELKRQIKINHNLWNSPILQQS